MIIALTEKGYYKEYTEQLMWYHLAKAFDQDFEIVQEVSDIAIPKDSTVVIVDETGDTNLDDFEHPENAVYIFGRAGIQRLQERIYCDHVIRIDTPNKICLFAEEAAAIVLYDRAKKNG